MRCHKRKWVMAMAEAQNGPAGRRSASEHIRKSIALATERGARPDLAITHFRFAEILQLHGCADPAREQLDQAEALFSDMGMDWWTEQAGGLRGRLDRGEAFVWFAPYVDGPPV